MLVLKELYDQIDAATAEAYGWPRDQTDEQILERLVALNADRPAAVLSVLDHAAAPLDVAAIARSFNKGGKRIEQAVVKALPALVRYVHVTALKDGRYAGRKAA